MLENGKISNRQFSILFILFTVGSTTMTVPSVLAGISKQDSWLASILSVGCGLLLTILYNLLAKRYPSLSLVQYCEKILGKWLGKMISLLFFLFFLHLTSDMVRIVGDLLTTHILTETPIEAINALFLLTVIVGVRYGLETFSRASEMLFPHVLGFFLLLVLFLIPQIKGKYIGPFLEYGLKPVFLGTYHILGLPFLELFIFLMIIPYVKDTGKVGKNMLVSTMIAGFVVTLITLFSVLVIGSELTSRLNFPPFVLAQKIDIANFIQRIEVLAGAFIFISIFVKITITFYAMVLSLSQTFQLKSYKPLTFPLGIIVLVLSIKLYPSIIHFRNYSLIVWTPLMLIIGLFFPLLLLVIDIIKSKWLKKESPST